MTSSSSPTRLILIGAGPVGQHTARLAAALDFAVTVIDDRVSLLDPQNFPQGVTLLAGAVEDVLPQLATTTADFVAIISQVWQRDALALKLLIDRPLAYLGMIGCQRKLADVLPGLAASGVPQSQIDRVYAPIGLSIGSRTPTEIAVSICAELIGVRSGKISRPAAT